MIIGFLLLLCALLIFAALNLFAATVFVAGLSLLVALWLRRKAEFWPLLGAMALLLGGALALSGSWGTYAIISHRMPDWGWPVLGWLSGYAVGGALGALLGVFGVALRRRRELPLVEAELKTRFRALRTRFSRLGFRQSLRVGAYSLRVALFKRADVS